jgi:hypothetical protein
MVVLPGRCPRIGLLPFFVIPAKAGIQRFAYFLGSRLRGNDVRDAFSNKLLVADAEPEAGLVD